MLTLITTTKDRALCFSLLEKWIARQTLQPDQWLVVNSSENPAAYEYTRGQQVICRSSAAASVPPGVPPAVSVRQDAPGGRQKRKGGGKVKAAAESPPEQDQGCAAGGDLPAALVGAEGTGAELPAPTRAEPWQDLLANWLCALPEIRGDKVIVCEDDDYYHPAYLETLAAALDSVDLAGIGWDVYYKLETRRFQRMGNPAHASLGASGFRASVLPLVKRCCRVLCPLNKSPFIDCYLWAEATADETLTTKILRNEGRDRRPLHVGFKCMPGTPGLGIGHKKYEGTPDNTFATLDSWLVGEASQAYRRVWRQHFAPAIRR